VEIMYGQVQEREQTSWNLSEYKINTIGQLMQRTTNLAILKKYYDCFSCWKQIALIIDNRLEDDEKENLDLLEKGIMTKGLKRISETENPDLIESERVILTTQFPTHLWNYAKYVNQLLKNVGMDIKARDESEEEMT